MKVDIYLVKDENVTVANFRNYPKAFNFIELSSNKSLTIEHIEVDLPPRKNNYENIENTKNNELIVVPPSYSYELSDKLENIVNNHIIKIYNKTSKNKTHTARILGITLKTLYNKLHKMGVS